MNRGKLYGIGVGPGDPDLMTLKAVRLICACDIVAVPNRDRDKCFALRIAEGAVPELEHKPILEIEMPMTFCKDARELSYEVGTAKLREQLDAGRTVAFLTLGDPTIYSTYCYLHEKLLSLGYEAEIVPGVTSFCASAAALSIPLCEDRQELHIIPGAFDPASALGYAGVKVFMKNNLPATLAAVNRQGLSAQMVENCGTDSQKIYRSAGEIPENAGYYSVMIVKEEEK